MVFLVLSILFSVAVSVFLKLAQRTSVALDQAIAANYGAASVLCLVLLRPSSQAVQQLDPMAWGVLALLGILLPSVFLIMAAAVHTAGIVRSDAAQRLSLLLPILAAFLVFHETLTPRKALGITLALCALAGLLARASNARHDPSGQPGTTGWLALLGVWAGYGVIDILFKQTARLGAGFTASLLLSFVLAGGLMTLWLSARRTRWQARSLAAGLLLGTLNFGNIYFYVRAHQVYPENPALVFAAMNIGVISVGTLVGAGLFRERLSTLNVAGIGLALVAIFLLIPR